jgi:serine/threonine protein kinase/tetratricopeptide (TPR) repeat protein
VIGKTISHYKIIEKLGQGGMGEVYLAEDSKLRRKVALKFLSSSISQDSEERTRFVREAQAAAALDHPNITSVYEIEETDKDIFIVMSFIKGTTLKEKISSIGPLSINETLNIAIQIAKGLKEAHDHGIVHRDIKSSNIIVDSQGQAKITDFGLAKFKGERTLTKKGEQLGTAAYMSPEQIRGEAADQQSDIFSLGVVMYEMLTGELPFKGEDEHAIMFSIVYDSPTNIRTLTSELSIELEQIVEKALRKEKNERYKSIDEIFNDLQKLQGIVSTKKNISKFKRQSQKNISTKSILTRIRKKHLRVIFPVIIILIVSIALVIYLQNIYRLDFDSKTKRIAIIPFENQSGEDNYHYLKSAIPNLLITNLEQSQHLHILTWERMSDLLKASGNDDLVLLDLTKDDFFTLCKNDGVQEIVLGSFTKAGNVFATEIKVLDVNTKKLLRSKNSKGKGVNSILEFQVDELSEIIYTNLKEDEQELNNVADITTHSMEAYNYFLRGRKEAEKKYPANARKFLEKAIELDSTFSSAYLYLAKVYEKLGMKKARKTSYEQAKRYSYKASEKERLYIEAMYAGNIEKDYRKKIRILEKLVKKFPEEKKFHEELAEQYLGEELYHQAIKKFNQALELDPNYGLIYNKLAYTYSLMGEYEKAFNYYERYASLSPGDANPFDSIAELYLRIGNLDNALAKFKEAIEVKSDFYYSYWKVAYIYALREEYSEAMLWINRLIQIAPTSSIKAFGLVWKGFYLFWLGMPEQSLQVLTSGCEQLNECGDLTQEAYAHWITGWIYLEIGHTHLAEEHQKRWYKNIISERPTLKMIAYDQLLRGCFDLNLARIDSVKLRISTIQGLLPKIVPAYQPEFKFYSDILQGATLLYENSANESIEFSLRMQPMRMPTLYPWYLLFYNVPYPKDILARAYIRTDQIDNAIREYERLTEFDPNTEERRLNIPNIILN